MLLLSNPVEGSDINYSLSNACHIDVQGLYSRERQYQVPTSTYILFGGTVILLHALLHGKKLKNSETATRIVIQTAHNLFE